jgi:hypothetical protein
VCGDELYCMCVDKGCSTQRMGKGQQAPGQGEEDYLWWNGGALAGRC